MSQRVNKQALRKCLIELQAQIDVMDADAVRGVLEEGATSVAVVLGGHYYD